MKSVNILSICGSGTVTSSMVAAKLKDRLSEHGYQVSATEAKPTEALNLAQSKRFDIIAHTSFLREIMGFPVSMPLPASQEWEKTSSSRTSSRHCSQ